MIDVVLAILAVSNGPAFVESPGPHSRLYLQDGNTQWMFAVQGDEAQFFHYNGGGNQGPIAVADTIRTTGAFPERHGYEISHSGQLIQQLPDNGLDTGDMWDGTTDGLHNFTIDSDNRRMLQFDRNWTNPTLMFTLPQLGFQYQGITWDPTNDTFWVASCHNVEHVIYNYSRQGQLLSSFPAMAGSQPGHDPLTWLALDPVDGTLWVGRQTFQGFIHNYKTTGEYIGTAYYSALHNSNTLGGEFQIVPTPAAWWLAVLAVLRRSRRRKTRAAALCNACRASSHPEVRPYTA